jgi:type I restriction enzyme S subunit
LTTKEVDFNIIYDTQEKITQDGLSNSSAKWVPEGATIIAMYGATAGKVCRSKIPLTTNQACCNIVVDSSLGNDEFLFYQLWSRNNELVNLATGAAQQNLSVGTIKEFPITLPPLAEQEAIAEVLSSLDDKIDLLKHQNKTLEAMAEALFRQWFIEEAQDDWDVMFLPEMCLQMGSGGTPSTKVKEYYEGSINWFATKELQDNFNISSVKMITQEAVNESAAKLFPKHTIMMAIYAAPTVGRLGILTSNGCFNQATCGFVAREEIGHEFIFTLLKNQREELNLLASGTAQQNLSVKKLKEFGMPLPDVRRISEWRDICRPIFQKWEANFHEISLLNAQRDTLLPKLMSGEVRVKLD